MTDCIAPIAFVVTIPRVNPADEFVERVSRLAWPDQDRSIVHGHVNGVALVQLRFARHGLREPETKAIPPLRQLSSCRHVSTMNIHGSPGGVKHEPGRSRRSCK